jgi:hypothetical protein
VPEVRVAVAHGQMPSTVLVRPRRASKRAENFNPWIPREGIDRLCRVAPLCLHARCISH